MSSFFSIFLLNSLPKEASSPYFVVPCIVGSLGLNAVFCGLFPIWGNYVTVLIAPTFGFFVAQFLLYMCPHPRTKNIIMFKEISDWDKQTLDFVFFVMQISFGLSGILMLPVILKVFAVPIMMYFDSLQNMLE